MTALTLLMLAGACVSPEIVPLQPTANAPGSQGTMTLTQPGSPFGITVGPAGYHVFDIEVRVDQMRRRPGLIYVLWVAKPNLDEYQQLGTLDEGGHARGQVAWNQFLVFVSEESTTDVERWQGPIMMMGLSPSGRLHTMAGHGPFEDMSCQQYY